ncbi:MAG: CinA family protein [Lachnospiraceae bacterium]|nr:CinA family protein [Lachnospiraceae bacterium]
MTDRLTDLKDYDEIRPAFTDSELARVLDQLRQRGELVTTVESLTAGMISARIADIPGSSDVLRRAYVTYSDEAKREMVGVQASTLEQWTAVSRQSACEMAQGGAEKAGAAACLSATGYAGPASGPEDTSVGHVFLGCFYRGQTVVEEHRYLGERNEVRAQAMNDALRMLAAAVR